MTLLGLFGFFPACKKEEKAKDVAEIEKVPLGKDSTIGLYNNYGPVFVLSGRSLPRSMWGKIVRQSKGNSVSEAKKNLKKITATSIKSGNQVNIRVKAPNQKDYRADLSVTVPVEAQIKVVNKKGKVSVLGVRGSIDVDSDVGDVVVRGMKGSVRIKNKKGDIVLSGGMNALDVENGRGNIRATLRYDKGLTQDSVLRVEKGDINLRLPQKFNAKVSFRSGSGHIVANFPLEKKGKKVATGTLGQGGKLLLVEAKKGKIRVLQIPMRHYKPYDARGLPRVRGGNPYSRRFQRGQPGNKKLKGPMGPNSHYPTWPRNLHRGQGHGHHHGQPNGHGKRDTPPTPQRPQGNSPR